MCLGAEGALNRGCKYNIFSKNMCFLPPPRQPSLLLHRCMLHCPMFLATPGHHANVSSWVATLAAWEASKDARYSGTAGETIPGTVCVGGRSHVAAAWGAAVAAGRANPGTI